MAKTEIEKPEMTRSQLIDALERNREERRIIEQGLKPLEAEYKELKGKIIESLIAAGEEKSGTTIATVSLSKIKVPVVEDQLAAMKYLVRTKNLHILLAQPFSTPSWRELVGIKGDDIPGTRTFEKIDLNHSSIKPV